MLFSRALEIFLKAFYINALIFLRNYKSSMGKKRGPDATLTFDTEGNSQGHKVKIVFNILFINLFCQMTSELSKVGTAPIWSVQSVT